MEFRTKILHDMPPLVYHPLPTPSSIRILDLYTGETNEHIRCKLRFVDLDLENNSYTGLSYCCGDPVDPIVIECDGQKTWITQSLYSALRKIRDIMPPATLWVDTLCGSLWVGALCINQSRETDGLHEREHQVQMMGCVFGNAIAVIVDLGERPGYFDGLLKVFHEITSVPEESCRAYRERGEVSEDFR
jgi:hypothetical protein